MTSTMIAFQAATRNLPASLARTAAAPQNANDSAYYLKHIGKVRSLDQFMADDRLYRYAMKAFGLSDMIYAKAFMRKVLEGGVDKRNSFANRLSDARYKEFATTFNFAAHGSATTSFDRTQQGTVDRFVRLQFETQEGGTNDNVRLALYFQRKAPELTNAFQILADRALLKVVQTALGIPAESSAMQIDKQAEMITKRLDLKKLKEPAELNTFLMRFSAMADAQSGASMSPGLSMLVGPQVPVGVNTNLMMSIQSLRLGGL
ncbi:MAG: DUF1217 domain-containing protein [Bosea sp.]|uniref:DUF1217 domain-containing protein n=1 Tax=Bosea sp. (in: a-proteobacteria) TaxID=1871050 RepID=UPI0023A09262|nr:DUF1217 domain-containing protein [Bosea sp. (in: a-proteobacteria)]MCP4737759.1 DUF1217 domain-containing protein [Bosea sp. (in: a-proteobacteria)]